MSFLDEGCMVVQQTRDIGHGAEDLGAGNKTADEWQSKSHGQEIPDVRLLMSQIRERIANDIEALEQIPFRPAVADIDGGAERRAGELLYSEDLRSLNVLHAAAGTVRPDSVATHRKGIVGKIIVGVKRKIRAIVWDLLKDYFVAEREFNGNVVRFLNDVSKYVDARDAANFWEIIRKIDIDTSRAMERIDRIHDDSDAALRNVEGRLLARIQEDLGALRTGMANNSAQLETIAAVVKGIEGILSRHGRSLSSTSEGLARSNDHGGRAKAEVVESSVPDFSYLLLENRFRGSEEIIRKRVTQYADILGGATAPIVEIGSGRGELLDVFRDREIEAYGVDIDAAMTALCRQKGHNVVDGDGIEHLASKENRSIGGVIAVQVVEHLQREQLERFFRVCAEKIVVGGSLIVETINPQSLLALSSNYFRDPTHVWPLHPDTLSYQMELSGLTVREVRMQSPVPREAQLKELSIGEFLAPSEISMVRSINRAIQQLNGLLYGHQDYAIIAEAR